MHFARNLCSLLWVPVPPKKNTATYIGTRVYIEDWKLDPSGGYLATGFKRRWQPQPALFSDLQLIVAITTRDLYGPRGWPQGRWQKGVPSHWQTPARSSNERSRQPKTIQLIAKCFACRWFFSFIFIFGPQNVELNGFLLKSSCWAAKGGCGASGWGGKRPLIGS